MYRCGISFSFFIGFPTQLVDPIADEGTSTAGSVSGYTLICSTSKEPDLPTTTTLAVQWLGPRGNVISRGTNFTISGAGPTTDDVLTSRLTFNNLYTSQAGMYTCKTLQTIPGTVTNHPEGVTFTVQVKRKLNILTVTMIFLIHIICLYSARSHLTTDFPSQSKHYPQCWYLLLSHLCYYPKHNWS